MSATTEAQALPISRRFRLLDYISINSYWFALTTRSQTLSPLIVPLLVQRFVGEASKGAYVGRLRLWSLMVAVLVQALMGLLSDHSTLRMGRRRPFIAAGTLGEVVVFVLMGTIAGMEGMAGYVALFGLYILSMIGSNTAQAATQGLIPDLVPEAQRGRFSGVKAFLELPIPLVFTSLVVARLVANGSVWAGLLALIVVLLVCMALAMFAPEKPIGRSQAPLDWQPLLRLALMTVAFTIVILGAGAGFNVVMRWVASLPGTLTPALTVAFGVVGMALAVLVGVWLSVSLSLGGGIRDQTSFTWWVTCRLAFLVGSTNLASFMLYFMQERFAEFAGERAAVPSANVMMAVGLMIMVTALPSGWLADRLGKRVLVAISAIVAAAGTFLILLVPTMGIMYVGGSMIGAAIGLFYSASWALGTEIVPQGRAGQFLGISNLAGAGAGAIGAYIGGPIADANGYVLLFTIYGVMFLLAILALIGVKEKRVPSLA